MPWIEYRRSSGERADESVDIVCRVASAVPQAWQLAANSATLPLSRPRSAPLTLGRVS
jgi:hypothetical protein